MAAAVAPAIAAFLKGRMMTPKVLVYLSDDRYGSGIL